MKVTYLGHSGFAVETESGFYIFDYIRGELPSDVYSCGKPVRFFVSHFHEDHFNPEIFAEASRIDNASYIVSNDTRKSIKRKGLDVSAHDVLIAYANKTYELGEGVQLETLNSTDEGVAYIVTEPGGTIYHAGDLNWWDWPGEDENWNRQMEGSFKAEIKKIRDRHFDIAFLPLDPRQEDSYWKGMQFFLENVSVAEAYPMHFWEEPEIIDRYLKEHGEKFKAATLIHRNF